MRISKGDWTFEVISGGSLANMTHIESSGHTEARILSGPAHVGHTVLVQSSKHGDGSWWEGAECSCGASARRYDGNADGSGDRHLLELINLLNLGIWVEDGELVEGTSS